MSSNLDLIKHLDDETIKLKNLKKEILTTISQMKRYTQEDLDYSLMLLEKNFKEIFENIKDVRSEV
jgi:hypothetical protein